MTTDATQIITAADSIPAPRCVAHAKWIWSDDDPDKPNVWVWARRRFEVKAPTSAFLNITADLRYVAWVNGVMIGFGPPKYHMATPTLDRYDIAAHLHTGENVIAIRVYTLGDSDDISSCMPRRGALLGSIEADGQTIPTDGSWKLIREPGYLECALRRFDFQPHNEVFDARVSLGEPWRADYDDADWPAAVELSQGPAIADVERIEWRDIELIPWRAMPMDRVLEFGSARFANPAKHDNVETVAGDIFKAQRGPDAGDRVRFDPMHDRVTLDATSLPADQGAYIRWDLGQLRTGYPVVEVEGEPGTIIDLSYCEHLTGGQIDPSWINLNYFDRLILGDGVLRHRILWPKCCKFMQADVRCGRATFRRVEFDYSAYPVQRRGGFKCNDAVLDQAWHISAHTLELCMEDNYMDTPWRERGSWLGDIVPEAHVNYYAFGDAALLRRFLRQQARGQKPDGRMMGKYPGRRPSEIHTWNLSYALTLEDYVRHTGDAALIRELWPTVGRIMGWLEQYRTDEQVYGNLPLEITFERNVYTFVDWAPVDTRGSNTGFNAYAYRFWDSCARLAAMLGDEPAAADCAAKRDALGEAMRDVFWDETRGIFVNGRVNGRQLRRWGCQENYWAVLFGIATAEQVRSIIDVMKQQDLLSYFKSDPSCYDEPYHTMALGLNTYRWDDEKMVPMGTPYFAYWAMQALCELGMIQESLDLIRRHWGEFSRQGIASTWEQWDMGSSLSHGFSAGPVVMLGKYMLGVTPSVGDVNRVEIFPHRADLTWASGRMPLPAGVVQVGWRYADGWTLAVSIPAGCTAEVGLPARDVKSLTVNGQPASATGVVERQVTKFVTVDLPAGEYTIEGR